MILDEGLLESATIFRTQHQSMSLQRNSQDGSPDPSKAFGFLSERVGRFVLGR